jgi:cytidine deaminase
MRAETRQGRLVEATLVAEYKKTPDLSAVIAARDGDLIQLAVDLRKEAISYRNFLVGACSVGWARGRVMLFEGTNNSPEKGSPRDCAEMGIEDQAAILGDTVLRSLYVAGPEDMDAIELVVGRRVDTLPPCEECREMLWGSPHADPDMLVTSIAADLSRIETRPLWKVHGEYMDFVPPPPSNLVSVGA